MGYRLQMSAEIYDWLAELRGSDPPAAALAARALAALAADGDRLGPPLVTAAAAVRLRPDELLPALDRHYQARLAEERLTVESRHEHMRVDPFRTRIEVLKAAYTAARAEQLIEQAQDADDDAVRPDDPAGAAARLAEITGQIEQELDPDAPAEGLMELRPGAPADSDIRILFAVEPPGTALLIAVLEGRDAVQDHYREAVLLASEVLREARSGPLDQAAEAAAHTFGDAPSFLEEFFPGRADQLRAAADAHEVVAAYWAAAEARDWTAFGALLADDVIYRGPQTREQVRGRDPYIRFNVEGFPYDWHLTVHRIVGEGQRAASWVEFTGPDGTQPGLCFFDLADDGKIALITDFWPDPYELPASRAHLVERY